MKEIKTRLSPDNANKNNENYIFGNLENSIDYHNIKDYKINDITIEEIINTLKDDIETLNKDIKLLNEDLNNKINILKLELQETISEIIKGKVV